MNAEQEIIDEPTGLVTVAEDGEIAELPARVATPTQAKADAVSHLLEKAVGRTSELRLTPEETAALKAQFDDDCFRRGAGGKDNLIYLEGTWLRDRLDNVLGIGQWSLVPRSRWKEEGVTRNGDPFVKVYVEAMLIVRGCYITEAIGDMDYYPHNAQTNFGDAVEGAESACLRRCCKKMGIGLQAWSKTWCEGWWRRKGTQHAPSGSNYDEHSQRGYDDHPMPACPKCGKTDSVIQGKAEFGGGLVCYKKKNGGCGHKWDGKDVRTGEDAAPATEYPSILEEWRAKLDPLSVNLTKLNSELLAAYKAIPGQHPERAKVWKMIVEFATEARCTYSHGNRVFSQTV